ncbi:hypothetical protein [Micromonospora cathayae]|uniref:Uncharacterized protein n=1 Tax=Micromonospora cathayae TaxID=3028804 RepID=A0ABY7ZV55_9ACTN|nr:hypothetical protein [Micromonospora sp. HUAS 3]WDZ86373.1 hypothetical protein PVK37_08215 [Micromonospora sp. HUAS 3]
MTTTVFIDWSKSGSAGTPEPCVICGQPAICRSPKGKPCHKVCAESWATDHQQVDPTPGGAA